MLKRWIPVRLRTLTLISFCDSGVHGGTSSRITTSSSSSSNTPLSTFFFSVSRLLQQLFKVQSCLAFTIGLLTLHKNWTRTGRDKMFLLVMAHAGDQDRDREWEMMSFYIMLCTVHTTQGQKQVAVVFYCARPCSSPMQ